MLNAQRLASVALTVAAVACMSMMGCKAILQPLIHQPNAKDLCSKEQAYEIGMDHGVRDIVFIEDIAHVCNSSVRDAIHDAYAEGYEKGAAIALAEARRRTCNFNSGYTQGMNDSQNQFAMRMTAFEICEGEGLAQAQAGYRKGYTEGAKLRPAAPGGVAGGQAGGAPLRQCTGPTGSTCTVTLTIQDTCAVRGVNRLDYRFFNVDRRRVFPSNTQVYSSRGPNSSGRHDLQCSVGDKVCFGARSGQRYWGLGIEGNQSCQGCCVQCQNITPQTWTIGCF